MGTIWKQNPHSIKPKESIIFMTYYYLYFLFILHIENVLPSSGQLFPISYFFFYFYNFSFKDLLWNSKEIKKAHSQVTEAMIFVSGYYGEGLNAIIVFAACQLPDSSCEDYTYIMENLFL